MNCLRQAKSLRVDNQEAFRTFRGELWSKWRKPFIRDKQEEK